VTLDVDLEEPTPIGRKGHVELAHSNATGSAIRPTIRSKPLYHFSIKRPRRNVTKRSIATLPYLECVQEETEETTRPYYGGRDIFRSPRLALALSLFVCSAGGYRRFNELWISRKDPSTTASVTTHPDEDVTYSLGGLENLEQRGSFLRTKQHVIWEVPMGNATTTSFEDVLTVLFGETIVAPEQLSNLVITFHERFTSKYDIPLAHTTLWIDHHHTNRFLLRGLDTLYRDWKI
jgi:hypothetical protein